MNIIGIRKMCVLIWCAGMIALICSLTILQNDKPDPLNVAVITTGIITIGGLGGFHIKQQAKIDSIKD